MRETGVVKWFDNEKGYGFIQRENAADVFVHRTAIEEGYQPLDPGETVEFEVKPGTKGLQATNVLPVKRAEFRRWAEAKQRRVSEEAEKQRRIVEVLASKKQRAIVAQPLAAADPKDAHESPVEVPRPYSDFTIVFDPELTEAEIRGAFEALADYYRSCGGVGLEIRFELESAEVLEPVHV